MVVVGARESRLCIVVDAYIPAERVDWLRKKLYPTAGASDDYAYSRHLVDRRKGKIIAYTMEWGRSRASTPFHPPYDEMRKVMREVTAGLLELCVSVAKETRRGEPT